jgi:hypothetical protein
MNDSPWTYRGWKALVLELQSGRARAGIVVEGDLWLAEMRLRSLPSRLTVRGTLDLRQNQRLRRIGDGLTVDGDLLIGGKCIGDGAWCWKVGLLRAAQEGQNAAVALAKFSRDDQCPLIELPVGVRVGGDLRLSRCRYLAALPHDLKIGRSLRLAGCASLSRLPDPFAAKGDLEIISAPKLTTLPSRLEVKGNLRLVGVRLHELPKGLRVGGDLVLECCSRLVELPSGLDIGGSLLVRRCPIERLPDRLQVKGNLRLVNVPVQELPRGLRIGADLVLDSCSRLTALPAGLDIERSLLIKRCPIERLPDGLQIKGNLRLVGVRVQELPEDLQLGGNLALVRCWGVTGLPAGLQVGGSLLVQDCLLETLPADLCVGKNIRIHRAQSLESTPEGLSAAGTIELADCNSLVRIAPGLRVGWNLIARNCRNLKELPEGLQTRGVLDLRGCTSLERLPGGIRVGSDRRRSRLAPALRLADCSALRSLPDDLEVGGPIEIAGSGLVDLPERLLRSARLLWRGAVVPPEVVFRPESLTPDQIFGEPNAELRRLMLERVGLERVLRRANALTLDSDTDAGGKRRLVEVSVAGDPRVYLQCRCPSTGRHYLLRVPPGTPTCRHAAAWMAGLDDPEAYNPIEET